MEGNLQRNEKGACKCLSNHKRCSRCNDSSKDSRSDNEVCQKRPKKHSSPARHNCQSKCSHKNLHHCFHKLEEIKPEGVCCRCSSYTTKKISRCNDDKRSPCKKSCRSKSSPKKLICQVEISQADDLFASKTKRSVGVQCRLTNDHSGESVTAGSQKNGKIFIDHTTTDSNRRDSLRSGRKDVDHVTTDVKSIGSQKSSKKVVDLINTDLNRCDSIRSSRRSTTEENNYSSQKNSKKPADNKTTEEQTLSSQKSGRKTADNKTPSDSQRGGERNKKTASEKSFDVEVIVSPDMPNYSQMSGTENCMYENRQSGMSRSSSKDVSVNSMKDHLAECERTKGLLAEKLECKAQIIQDLQRQIDMIDKNAECHGSKSKQSKLENDGNIPKSEFCASKIKPEKLECDGNIAIYLELRTVSGKETFNFEAKHGSSANKGETENNFHSVTVDNE